MSEKTKSRVMGINHVALEVGDIEEALAFYGEFLIFELRSQSENMAFMDLGDQFLALSKGRRQAPDDDRHFGLVEMGVEIISNRFLDFLDPWGNRIEIIGYENIQFTKAPHVLRAMGLDKLRKSQSALKELAEKGMAAD
jgi:catechol 2,3-dioxygenase-like lactoylglutathione lyase family enzyme